MGCMDTSTPDDGETAAIQSDPTLMAAIQEGLDDAAAGRVHTHEQVAIDAAADATNTDESTRFAVEASRRYLATLKTPDSD